LRWENHSSPSNIWQQCKIKQTNQLGLGQYSHYRYTIDTDVNRYILIQSSCCIDTDDGDSRINNDYSGIKTKLCTLDFHTIRQKTLAYWVWSLLCWTNTLWIKVWYTLHRSFCFSTSFSWIQCIDQLKTFTLLLKFKILDIKTRKPCTFSSYLKCIVSARPVSIWLLTVSSQPYNQHTGFEVSEGEFPGEEFPQTQGVTEHVRLHAVSRTLGEYLRRHPAKILMETLQF